MKKGALLAWLSVSNIAFLVLVYAIGKWIAEDYPFSTFIAYAPPAIWLIPTLILLPFGIGKGNRNWLKTNAIVAVLFGWLLLGIKVPFRADRSGAEGSFTVMTFNMMGAKGGLSEVLRIINEAKPDFICLQEGTGLDVLRSGQDEIPGYHIFRKSGVAIASKEPPIRTEVVPLFPGSPGAVEAEFSNGLKLVSAHLSFHRLDTTGRKGIPVHMQNIARMHEVEVRMLTNRYASQPNVIIAGDFNLPPRGKIYDKLTRSFTDAFASAGWLTGYTWPSQFPVQRIDYAFTTNVKVKSARTISSTVSNHLPVLFRFKI